MVITDKQNFELIDKIKNLNVFNQFEEDQIEEFINVCTLKKFAKGEIIINEGSVNNWIYILISGSVKILKGDQIFGIFKRIGEVLGRCGLLLILPVPHQLSRMLKQRVSQLTLPNLKVI